MKYFNCLSKKKKYKISLLLVVLSVLLAACGGNNDEGVVVDVEENNSDANRSSIPQCLTPEAPGEVVYGIDNAKIDASNTSEGYICVIYSDESDDVKLQISHEGDITYTYKIKKGETVLPITQGDGLYNIVMYEGMGNGQYSALFADEMKVSLNNDFSPYRYPNYYVNYDINTKAVGIAEGLAKDCQSDLEVIAAVYEYVTSHITYDHEEAENVASDYVPNVDEVLESGKGICFDYASLMAAMLRSQRIPTRLEIGYAGDAYHAWVTTYVADIGWINGIIEFDGFDWTLMDPTFAANADAKTLKQFVGSGDNYTTKYVY